MEDGTFFIIYLSREHVPTAACFFTTFVDRSFQLCNNWLCTSLDVEAGFNYLLSKKYTCMYLKKRKCITNLEFLVGTDSFFQGVAVDKIPPL
jgi:hypothetical protein